MDVSNVAGANEPTAAPKSSHSGRTDATDAAWLTPLFADPAAFRQYLLTMARNDAAKDTPAPTRSLDMTRIRPYIVPAHRSRTRSDCLATMAPQPAAANEWPCNNNNNNSCPNENGNLPASAASPVRCTEQAVPATSSNLMDTSDGETAVDADACMDQLLLERAAKVQPMLHPLSRSRSLEQLTRNATQPTCNRTAEFQQAHELEFVARQICRMRVHD